MLKEHQVTINPYGRRLQPEETKILIKDSDAIIAGTEQLSEEVLNQASSLRIISRVGTGTDNIDVGAAKDRGIKIFSTPEIPYESVAELTLGMILGLAKRIAEADRNIRNDLWKPLMGSLIKGKTLGLIGLGRVGRRVVELVEPFEMNIVAYDPKPQEDFINKHQVRIVLLEELLRVSDIISIHAPLTSATHQLIGSNELGLMKESALLINTSRGHVIDENALYTFLESKQIAGAALDVFQEEPYNGPLRHLINILLTSHMGSCSKETRKAMEEQAIKNVLENQ